MIEVLKAAVWWQKFPFRESCLTRKCLSRFSKFWHHDGIHITWQYIVRTYDGVTRVKTECS